MDGTTELGRAYRAAWWSVAGTVAVVGLLGACLVLGLGALVLAGMVAALIVLVFSCHASAPTAGRPGAVPSVIGSLLGGVAVLASTGLILELGAAGWWLSVLVAVAGWPVFRRPLRATAEQRSGPGQFPQRATSRVTATPPVAECLPLDPLPELSALPALSTSRLCWAWRVSYLRVQQSTCASQRAHLAELRRNYLEELQHRDPAAFSRWLPTARAASDPARFFCPPPPPPSPPIDQQPRPRIDAIRSPAPPAPAGSGPVSDLTRPEPPESNPAQGQTSA